MTAMARNMFLMCFSAFVLHTAILAHADVGYLADNKQKIKEYIASDTLHYYIKDYQGKGRSVVLKTAQWWRVTKTSPTEGCAQPPPRFSPINTEQKSSIAPTASTYTTLPFAKVFSIL